MSTFTAPTVPVLTNENLVALNAVLVEAARVSRAKVRIRYVKPNTKAVRIREVFPNELRTSNDGNLYVRGYDPQSKETRNFRLDRMTRVVEVIVNPAI